MEGLLSLLVDASKLQNYPGVSEALGISRIAHLHSTGLKLPTRVTAIKAAARFGNPETQLSGCLAMPLILCANVRVGAFPAYKSSTPYDPAT